jgi:uncharacterized protein
VPLDLPAEQLRTVAELLARHFPKAAVLAYGSRVSGQSHDGSDLDLVIRAEQRLPAQKLAALRAEFEESNLPIAVHLFDWFALPEKFQAEIMREHVVVR